VFELKLKSVACATLKGVANGWAEWIQPGMHGVINMLVSFKSGQRTDRNYTVPQLPIHDAVKRTSFAHMEGNNPIPFLSIRA